MKYLKRYIDLLEQRLALVLVVSLALTLAAGYLASGLTVDADLRRLLPHSAPSVAGLDRLEESYGGQIGRLTIVLSADEGTSEDRVDLTDVADELEPTLASLSEVRRVEVKKPVDFFEERRLLYADYADLETAGSRIEARINWEKKRANPLFVAVDDKAPPEVDVSDLLESYDERGGLDSAYFTSEDGSKLAIFIYPNFTANDLERSQSLVEAVEEVVGSHLRQHAPGVGLSLTGRYKKRVDLQNILQTDLALATSLALVLLFVFLLVYLRSATGALAVLIPIVVAAVWTFAWAEIVFDSLNILTGFLGAILMGLGVDYGIHLYSRFHDQNRRHSMKTALAETLATTGRVNVLAGLTTMVALASLTLSEFRAFYEFGIIAVGGLLFVLFAYAVLFPTAILVASRFGFQPRAPMSQLFARRAAGAAARRASLDSLSKPLGVALVVVLVAGALGLPRVEFERSFKVLETTSAPSWKLDAQVNDMLGHSQTPSVVLTDSVEQTQQVTAELERRRETTENGYTIGRVLSLASVLPSRQDDKLDLLEDLKQQLDDLPKKARKGELAEYRDELERVFAAGPISAAGLPEAVSAPFRRNGAPAETVVLVLPAIDLADIEHVSDYVDVLRDLPGVDNGGGYDAISDAALLVDIVRYVERDALWMLLFTIAGLVVLSALFFRRRRDVLLQFAMLGGAMLAAVGVLGWVGASFNFLNIIVLPIWLGLGIDASFHVVFLRRERHVDLSTHATTAAAIMAAFVTSMLGFGSMLVARHQGLASLGEVAVWGLGMMLVVNLLFHAFALSSNPNDQR